MSLHKILLSLTMLLGCLPVWAQFDHGCTGWDALVKKHVRWLPDQKQSRVDYDGFEADRAVLKKVLDAMSAVPQAELERWPREQQMAFLAQ